MDNNKAALIQLMCRMKAMESMGLPFQVYQYIEHSQWEAREIAKGYNIDSKPLDKLEQTIINNQNKHEQSIG